MVKDMVSGLSDMVQHLESGLQLLPKSQGKLESKNVGGTQVLLTAGSDSILAWGGSSKLGRGLPGWCLDSCLSCDSCMGIHGERMAVVPLWI